MLQGALVPHGHHIPEGQRALDPLTSLGFLFHLQVAQGLWGLHLTF